MNWPAILFSIGVAATATAETNWVGVLQHPVKDRATHEMLRALIDEADPVVRDEAVRALAAIGDPADVVRVRARLGDPHPAVRVAAVRALAALGMELAPGERDAVRRDPEPAVRAAAMELKPATADAVQQGLADDYPGVRRAAVRAATNLAGGIRLVADRWPGERDGATALVMFHALWAAATGPDRAELMQQALLRDQGAVVAAALELADETATTQVLEKLDDPAVAVREAATRAAGRLKLVAAEPKLRANLATADSALRPATCAALGQIGEDASVPVLASRVAADADWFTQRAAAEALTAIHTESARAALVELLGSARVSTRRAAVCPLGQWGEPAVAVALHPLVDDADVNVAAAAAEALGRLRDPASRPVLVARLARGPAAVQERVAWALGQYPAPEAVPALTQLLWSKDEGLEVTAAESLGLIGDRRAGPALRQILVEMKEHRATVRVAAVRALHRMGDRECAGRMFELAAERVVPPPFGSTMPLYDAVPVRVAALGYLREFGDATTGERLVVRLTISAGIGEETPRKLRPALAATLTRLLGRFYEPVPDETHICYSVESLGPPPYPLFAPPPGVRERAMPAAPQPP